MSVVVAGGGPGGMMLAYLLARARIPVTLLETHRDFDRDFRGDSLHPYTLELLAELGLADDLLALPHHRARHFRFHTPHGTVSTADYGKVASPYNYVALMPQAVFLDFLAERAAALPDFTLRLGCRVNDLLTEGERITGVRYTDDDGTHELTAQLVVAADGRFSKLRARSGLAVTKLGASTDLLWFRLPHADGDPPDADVDLFFGRDNYVGLLAGPTGWQVGYTLPKGGYPALREAGLEPVREFVAGQLPWLAERVAQLRDFSQTTLLSVDISRVSRWYRPGLLLIGDAAHVISPVGGNGILMAIQDAVAAANRLIGPLRTNTLSEQDLAAVQAEREPAIVAVQEQQVRIERRFGAARDAGRPIAPPRFLRWITAIPGVRARAARANAYGPRPPTVDTALLAG